MMKKQLFNFIMLAGSITTLACAEKDDIKKCYKINMLETHHRYDTKNGIASTTHINGVPVWNLLHNYQPMNADNVFVVYSLPNGEFSLEKALSEFNQSHLAHVNKLLLHDQRYFDLQEHRYVPYIDGGLTKSLREGTCALCVYGNGKQVIITDIQGTPQEAGEKLEFSIQKKADEKKQEEIRKEQVEIFKKEEAKATRIKEVTQKYNPQKTWRQKQREAAGK
jgi:hypothetical protein